MNSTTSLSWSVEEKDAVDVSVEGYLMQWDELLKLPNITDISIEDESSWTVS